MKKQTKKLSLENLEARQLLTASGFVLDHDSYSPQTLHEVAAVDNAAWFRLGWDTYRSDGTSEGTELVPLPETGDWWFYKNGIDPVALVEPRDPADQRKILRITDFTTVGNEVYLAADGHVWATGDTPGEATQLSSQPVGGGEFSNRPALLLNFQGTVFAYAKQDGRLWQVNQASEVELVHDFRDAGLFDNFELMEHGGQLWVFVQGQKDSQLWTITTPEETPFLVKEWSDITVAWSDVSFVDAGVVGDGPGIAFTVGENRIENEEFEFFNKQLWVSDGTAAGTAQIDTPAGDGMILETAATSESLFYVQQNDAGNFELWQHNFLSTEKQLVHRFSRIFRQLDSLAMSDNGFLFLDGDDFSLGEQTVYRMSFDGGSVEALKTFDRGVSTTLQSANGRVFFAADDGNGLDIWASDGSDEGTESIVDRSKASPFFPIFSPDMKAIIDGKLVYTANNLLWSAEPGESPTAIAEVPGFTSEIVTDEAEFMQMSSQPDQTTILLGNYFNNPPVWLSDGTRSGTRFFGLTYAPAPNLLPGDPGGPGTSFGISDPVTIGNTTFYVRSTPTTGAELWAEEDGQSRLLKDILPGDFGSSPRDFTVIDDILYFQARDRTTLFQFGDIVEEHEENWEVYRSDGTSEGTYKLIETNPDPEAFPFSTSDADAANFRSVDQGFMFNARFQGDRGGFSGPVRGWFSSDGTPDGTFRIESLDGAQLLLSLPDALVFAGGDGVLISDGTEDGTVELNSIEDFNVDDVKPLGAIDNVGFFAIVSESGVSIWRSDATSEGTESLLDFSDAEEVRTLWRSEDSIYFVMTLDSRPAIYRLNQAGIKLVKQYASSQTPVIAPVSTTNIYAIKEESTSFVPTANQLLIYSPNVSQEIYDPITGDLREVERLPYSIRDAIEHNGVLYFVPRPFLGQNTNQFGTELWSTDGTQDGTFVYDITPGIDSTTISDLLSSQDGVYLTADLRTPERETVVLRLGDPIEGDLDEDGEVGFSDFLRLATNFGQENTSPDEGDLTGDGNVGFDDFLILATNFGKKQFPSERIIEPMQQNLDGIEAVFAQRENFISAG